MSFYLRPDTLLNRTFPNTTIKSEEKEKIDPIDPVKQNLAKIAADEIEEGQIVGIGAGSISTEFIKALAKRCKNGLNITAVVSSNECFALAEQLGINIKRQEMLDNNEKHLDVYIGEADEVDENFNMIKGREGSLHREKVLASSSKKVIIMINAAKQVKLLGNVKIPLEVTKFGCDLVLKELKALGYTPEKRKNKNGTTYITDDSNYILDVELLKLLDDPKKTHNLFKIITGVVETGIFIGLIDKLIICDTDQNYDIINVKETLEIPRLDEINISKILRD